MDNAGNNWQDYNTGKHLLRSLLNISNTLSGLGIAGGLVSGNTGLALTAAHLNPILLGSKLGYGAGQFLGSSFSGLTKLIGNAVGLNPELIESISHLFHSFAPALTAYGGMKLMNKFTSSLTPKTVSILVNLLGSK